MKEGDLEASPAATSESKPHSPAVGGGGGDGSTDSNSRVLLPVLIVPGFMSSGLEVQKSGVDESWVGKRVWINLPALGFGSLRRGGALRVNEERRRQAMILDEEEGLLNGDGEDEDDKESRRSWCDADGKGEDERRSVRDGGGFGGGARAWEDGPLGVPRSPRSVANQIVSDVGAAAATVGVGAAAVAKKATARRGEGGEEGVADAGEGDFRGVGERRYSVALHEEYERQSQCKSDWLQHMSLSDDMRTERGGMKVRAIGGLAGVDYLMPGALTNHLSYVFAPVIKALRDVGYEEGKNLDAAPYDWRIPPCMLESRDGYFTGIMRKVESLYRRNNDTPVVLLCHSLGCKTAHYFLNFVLERGDGDQHCSGSGGGGRRWLDRYVHTYMPVGAPSLGAPKALRALVDGDKMGLDAFLSDEEGLILGRSLGSVPWLLPGTIPSKCHWAPPCAMLRREGTLHVTIASNSYAPSCASSSSASLDCAPVLWGRKTEGGAHPMLRLGVAVGTKVLMTKFKRPVGPNARVCFPEHFVFTVPLTRGGASKEPALFDDRLQIVLQKPGLHRHSMENAEEKKEEMDKDSDGADAGGSCYSCLFCPLRRAVRCAWCTILLPFTIIYIVYTGLKTLLLLTLNADVFAASAGATMKVAKSRTIHLSKAATRRSDHQEISVDLIDVIPYRERLWACCNIFSDKEPKRSISVTVRLRWEDPSIAADVSASCSPIAEEVTSPRPLDRRGNFHRGQASRRLTHLGRVRHKKKTFVWYEPTSGGRLLAREGMSRVCRFNRDCYDADPLGPRTLSAEPSPPVGRVKAVYGVNLPTEVCAVYRRVNRIQDDQRVQKLHELDKSARLYGVGGKYEIKGGIIFETKQAPQTIVMGPTHDHSDKHAERTHAKVVVHRSGDGTVPYWSLQHCRTWEGSCNVVVDEIDGAEHREILADDRFHKILVDYVTQKVRMDFRN